MLRVITIDDEPLALRQIESYIKKIPFLELVASCNSPLQAQQMLTKGDVDLIFVDINMPDLNGIDLVRSLVRKPMVIFTTAYSEYAIEGFRLDAVDYLLKPFSFAEFSRAVAKAQSIKESSMRDSISGEELEIIVPRDREYISVKADYKVSLIKISDILFIESEGEYVRIHINDGRCVTTLYRLKNMEAALSSHPFMRVHRSYIVNLKCIKTYDKGRIYISDSEFVPIGEIYRDAFAQYIENNFQNL